MAFGFINAGSSIGQLILAPIAGFIIVYFGWVYCILFLSLILLLVLPLSFLLRSRIDKKTLKSINNRSLSDTLNTAFKTPSYIYLVTGFFVCGFHVAFIATHMPGVIQVCGFSPTVSGWSLGIIGLFNILGSIFAGWYISKRSMRIFLAYTYFARCIIVLLFLVSPKDLLSVMLFSICPRANLFFCYSGNCWTGRKDVWSTIHGNAFWIRTLFASDRWFSWGISRRILF